jgi:hypothetical protein
MKKRLDNSCGVLYYKQVIERKVRFEMILIPNINEFEGMIPVGYNLVVYEAKEDPMDGFVLYGFDEIGLYDNNFKVPAYAMVEFQ